MLKFHHWTIRDFLKEMLAAGKNAGMRNTVCILPSEFGNYTHFDWEGIAKLDGLDIISTDPYWFISGVEVEKFVRGYCEVIKKLADPNNLEPQIWIQGFRVPSGREFELKIAIETAFSEGIRNLAIWGFEACRQMSSLTCDDPDLVWKTAIEAFKSANEKTE